MPPTLYKDLDGHPWWAWILLGPPALVLALILMIVLGACWALVQVLALVFAPVALFRSWAGRKGRSPGKSPTGGQSAPVPGKYDDRME